MKKIKGEYYQDIEEGYGQEHFVMDKKSDCCNKELIGYSEDGVLMYSYCPYCTSKNLSTD